MFLSAHTAYIICMQNWDRTVCTFEKFSRKTKKITWKTYNNVEQYKFDKKRIMHSSNNHILSIVADGFAFTGRQGLQSDGNEMGWDGNAESEWNRRGKKMVL